jgi:hypothetical protein
VKGAPSWNFTFGRSVNRVTVGSIVFHAVASEGSIFSSFPRVTSVSKIWSRNALVNPSLFAWGSIVVTSPWLDHRSVAAAAGRTATRATSAAARRAEFMGSPGTALTVDFQYLSAAIRRWGMMPERRSPSQFARRTGAIMTRNP